MVMTWKPEQMLEGGQTVPALLTTLRHTYFNFLNLGQVTGLDLHITEAHSV